VQRSAFRTDHPSYENKDNFGQIDDLPPILSYHPFHLCLTETVRFQSGVVEVCWLFPRLMLVSR
jgi:hypothetical protein